MLRPLYNFPRHKYFLLAASGGVDSMAVADFYKRGGKSFSLAYFHHNTSQADEMEEHLRKWSTDNKIQLLVGRLDREAAIKDPKLSLEEWWRIKRYQWLASVHMSAVPVITCHHLDDAVEGWVFSSMHGNPKVIASKIALYDANVYRPFLANTKQDFINWCTTHNVQWVEDRSNRDVSHPRNRIRYNVIPELLKINPGLRKVIKKKILSQI